MVAGLALVAGLAGGHAYGADPAAGVLAGACVAVLYSVYVFMLRQATAGGGDGTGSGSGSGPSPVATLFEATLGAAAGSLVFGLGLHDFRGPAHIWQALGWLALLAITSQVIGWLLITSSMSRLPAWTIGVVLLIQPAGSVSLGFLILNERPSIEQLAGVALMLAGVLAAVGGRRPVTAGPAPAQDEYHPPRAGDVQAEVVIEVAIPGGDAETAV
jgi:drug/metabolite transporter (DMT)-like permease